METLSLSPCKITDYFPPSPRHHADPDYCPPSYLHRSDSSSGEDENKAPVANVASRKAGRQRKAPVKYEGVYEVKREGKDATSPRPVLTKVVRKTKAPSRGPRVISTARRPRTPAQRRSLDTTARRRRSLVPDPTATKVTDFFPVRRSGRKTDRQVKKERQSDLERKILDGCQDGLKVEQVPGKGRGIIATRDFQPRDFVVEYAGELIELSEAKAREGKYERKSDLGCYMYYFKYGGQDYCIDATEETKKYGRLLNHSRKVPNCVTKTVAMTGSPHPRLILVALAHIKPGEEMLYDYGDRDKETLEAHPWLNE